MEKSQRLPLRRILAFGVGDIFGGGSFNIFNFLYPVYIVLAVGLSPFYVAIIMFLGRVIDAAIDPLLGHWSDSIRVKYGSRRRTLFISAPMLVLALFLAFYPYNLEGSSELFRFFAALFSYLFYCLVSSSIMVPYWSLASEITDDYTERGRMTSWRLGFSIFSSIVCVALPGMIVDAHEGNQGYMVMSLVFGVLFMICILVTAIFAKEGIPNDTRIEKFSLKEFLKPFKLKSFRQYLFIFLGCQITMTIMSSLFFFYVMFYYLRDVTAVGGDSFAAYIAAAIMFAIQIVALPFYLHLIKRVGKTKTYIVGAIIWIIVALSLFIIPANSPYWVLFLLAALMGFGISGPGLIPHAMFGDIVDVGHLKFGVRDAGSFSGIGSFVNTTSQGVGLAIAMSIIGMAGFAEQQPGMPPIYSQPESAQTAIILLMALTPLILLSIAIFYCTRYRLDKVRHAKVIAAIESGDENDRELILRELEM